MELKQAEFLTVPQAGSLLGVSAYVIRQSVKLHRLPALKLPTGATRIRRTELQAWVDEQQTRAVGA